MMARKVIRTKKADVYGDVVEMKKPNRQSGGHKSQRCTVSKDVIVDYETSSPKSVVKRIDRSGSSERLYAKKVDVSAKEIDGPWIGSFFGKIRNKIHAKNDVTLIVNEPSEKPHRRRLR